MQKHAKSQMEIERLSVSLEKQDQLKAKFLEVFEQGATNINELQQKYQVIILVAIVLEPLLQNLWGTFESQINFDFIRTTVAVVLSIRALIFAAYLSLLRKRKRQINNFFKRMLMANSQNDEIEQKVKERVSREKVNQYLLLAQISALMIGLPNCGLVVLFQHRNTLMTAFQQQWVFNYQIYQMVIFGTSLVCFQIRFKFKRKIMRPLYITALIWSSLWMIISVKERLLALQIVMCLTFSTVTPIELVWWRNKFFAAHQEKMLLEFDIAAQSLKEETLQKMESLVQEFDSGNQNTNSKAEDLLLKLRLLKYQQLIQKNEFVREKFKQRRSAKLKGIEIQNLVQSVIPRAQTPKTNSPKQSIDNFKVDDNEDGMSIDYVDEEEKSLGPPLLNEFRKEHSIQLSEDEHKEEASDEVPPQLFVSSKQSHQSQELPRVSHVFQRKPVRQLTSHTYEQSIKMATATVSPPKSQVNQVQSSQESKPKMPVVDEEVKLSTEDIDDLIKILTGSKEQIWLPYFLRSAKSFGSQVNVASRSEDNYSPEAKLFILDHFTEKEFNFKPFTLLRSEESSTSPSWHFKQNSSEILTLSKTDDKYNFDFNELIDQGYQSSQLFVDYCTYVFLKFSIHKTLKVNNFKIMSEFFKLMESSYKDNPYHNCVHAIDVTNSASFFLYNGLGQHLSDFETACLIISCLAHDLGHPGLNNGFMVSAKSKQALLYNDQSVLENYHAALLFHMLQDERSNILKNLEETDWKGFRKYCLTLILDTDLQKHFQLLSKFKNYLALGEQNLQDEQNRLLVMSITIKCADVGHGAKSLDLHKTWSRRIIEEFFKQGDLERQIEIAVTPMCDRSLSVTKSQEGFLRAIVLPLFEAFDEMLKSKRINETCIKQINTNIVYWQEQQKEEQDNPDTLPSFFRETEQVLDQTKIKSRKDFPSITSLINIMA